MRKILKRNSISGDAARIAVYYFILSILFITHIGFSLFMMTLFSYFDNKEI